MDSFEINKIVAAVLMVALLVIGIGKLSDVIFHVEKPETPGYAVDVEEAKTVSSSAEASVEEKIDINALMAMGDLTHGEKVFKKCAACHSIVKGGKNNIGPALYNVVGRKVGLISDYKYSKAMSEYKKDCIFLHCLPRGNEVTDDIFLGKKSHVWQQALNRVHVQKSILLYCFGKLR